MVEELRHSVAPEPVRAWIARSPGWLEIVKPRGTVTLARLDAGESEAIALAIETHADLLLLDEQAGRLEAARQGLKVAGTLAVLDDADQAGIIKFEDAVARMRGTSFRISLAVLAQIREKRIR